MNDERFQRVKAILSEAVERPVSERAAFLDRACAGDAALREEIDRILSADPARWKALQTGALNAWMARDLDVTAVPTGSVGPYRLLSLLGEGGMGAVYLAEQTTPIRRQVAIKLIKLGMDTRDVITRFEAERQALALLDHPHVAHVLEAGATAEGRPYFVMEYVPGVPITEFCDRQKLAIDDRLRIFMDVCAALHHAHQRGLIHRDVKPSNILVYLEDGTPTPKVIDFGIAKATNQRLTEHSFHTEQGILVGTPEYMSPEQAEMSALGLDTTTDVYFLGVVLYELLTGALPIERERLRNGGWESIPRLLREAEVPRPSERVTGLGNASHVASYRRTSPSTLRRQLRGDLDWIVMKAIEKDRNRRYASVSELAADLERYLNQEPVLAGPPTTVYRLRKFARRYRVALAVTGILFVVLGLGLLESNRQRVIAERARSQSEAVTGFLVQMLTASDPRNQGRSTPVGDILDRAAGDVGTRFEAEPAVKAELETAIGTTYRALGDFTSARTHLEDATRIWTAEAGPEHQKTLAAMNQLGILSEQEGRFAEAESIHTRVLSVQRGRLGSEHRETLDSMSNLATAWAGLGRREEAIALLEEALPIQIRVAGEKDRQTLGSMHNLANLYREAGHYERAESLHVRVLGIQRRVLPPEHPELLASLNSLAVLYVAMKRFPEAERLLRETIEIRHRTLGPEHPETLTAMNNLASLYFDLGRYDDAAASHRSILEIRRRTLGPEHPHTLISMGNLGDAYTQGGNPAVGEPLLREAVLISARVLGPSHAIHCVTLRKLGVCLGRLGRYAEAEQTLLRAHALLSQTFGPTHERTRLAERDLADLYQTWGNTAAAESWRSRP